MVRLGADGGLVPDKETWRQIQINLKWFVLRLKA